MNFKARARAFLEWMERDQEMEFTLKDNIPLFIMVLSLSLAIFNPVIRENDVTRVGWAIIHTIIATGYITGLIILKAIRNLENKIK